MAKKAKYNIYPVVAVVLNIVLAYVIFMIAHVEYFLENYSMFKPALDSGHWGRLLTGIFYFDSSAIVYVNALYIVLMLLPLHLKENPIYNKVCKWVYVIFNSLALVVNLCDSVYFQYTLRRTTTSVFREFSGEGNLASIFGKEFINHWYLVLLAAVLIFAMWKLYVKPTVEATQCKNWRYYLLQTVSLLVAVPLCVVGMRGGYHHDVRPITVSNATQYVDRPTDAALVLNTPFSLIRTIGKDVFNDPGYCADKAELERIFTPLHQPVNKAGEMKKKNVVIIIIESFGREYIGGFNKDLLPGYKGYTPFADSLMQHSITYHYSYCNGRKSIDGMPSILSSVPMFVEPFVLTPQSMNRLSGIAGCLGKKGWHTAFYHGATNGSMGFEGFARATGFQEYWGRDNYREDSRTNGDKDFDGYWGIWDEPFMQYFATKLGEMRQPFFSALFTLSSHHPFRVPDQYKNVFKEGELPIHKCITYTDNALRKFFDTARQQRWFDNTIFVITSDHTNMSNHDIYKSDIGGFCSPIIIYDPTGEMGAAGMRDQVAQQIDIMPTILNYLGYDEPYIAFGCDLLNTATEDLYAVNYLNGIYQYVKYGYVMQFDGSQVTGMYTIQDQLMKNNLLGKVPVQAQMELELKAIIQQYMDRMLNDRLVP